MFDNTREQAEEVLLKAGALQKAIFNSANFSSIATDANGVIQIFNVGAERMLGYVAAEVVNKITPADISDPREVIARAEALSVELGTPITPGFDALVFKASRAIEDIYELTYIRKDGSRFPAMVSVTALRDAQEAIIGYLLIGTDNTARKRVEAVEAESRRNWQITQSIVDTIRDPLVVLEHDMTIVMASKAFLTMFAITEAQAHGLRFSDLGQRQWDVPALRNLMDKVFSENKPIESFEIEDEFPGLGRRIFNLNARKISRPGNHAHRMLLVFEDITDRKQRERDAEMLANEISHRIKNNLQLIVGLIAYETRSTAQPYVQGYAAMQARIGAIAQLYDLISQSSRGQAVAVDAYLREIAKMMSASLLGNTSGVVIDVEAEALYIDPDRAVPFGLLVNELATNAIKHAFPDGVGRVVLGVEQVDDQIELIVADNGVGMKVKDVAKVPEKRGSDYVAIFVRQLGGTIVPPGAKEIGTTVKVRLPLFLLPAGHPERVAA